MKPRWLLTLFALLAALFLYLFYRTPHTVVGVLARSICGDSAVQDARFFFQSRIHLHPNLIYSLPEGLWVFAITLTSKDFYVKILGRSFSLRYFPLMVAALMEALQAVHLSPGRFDVMDLLFSLLGWMLATWFVSGARKDLRPLFRSFQWSNAICVLSYAIVYLAHVNVT